MIEPVWFDQNKVEIMYYSKVLMTVNLRQRWTIQGDTDLDRWKYGLASFDLETNNQIKSILKSI